MLFAVSSGITHGPLGQASQTRACHYTPQAPPNKARKCPQRVVLGNLASIPPSSATCWSRLHAGRPVSLAASADDSAVVGKDDNEASNALSGLKKVSWLSFWAQLALSLASGGVLFFTMVTTKQTSVSSLFLTIGVAMSMISTFMVRTVLSKARSIARGENVAADLAGWDVSGLLLRNTDINLVGMAATIIALQGEIGLLVAKTLTSSSANPYAVREGAPAAIDVFAVQGAANVLLAHFVSILAVTFLLRFIGRFNKSTS